MKTYFMWVRPHDGAGEECEEKGVAETLSPIKSFY